VPQHRERDGVGVPDRVALVHDHPGYRRRPSSSAVGRRYS
jgi:hypothetical protein